jgi:hypothetical protein
MVGVREKAGCKTHPARYHATYLPTSNNPKAEPFLRDAVPDRGRNLPVMANRQQSRPLKLDTKKLNPGR